MGYLEEIIKNLLAFVTTTGLRLVIALVLFLIGMKLIKVLVRFISGTEGFSRIDPSVQGFTRSFISVGLKILLAISLAGFIGLEMTSVLAVLASAGLAIGLALQGALGNLAGGLMILLFKPFRVGDYIDNHTDAGTVTEINVFYTVLNTVENNRIMLPNGALTNTSIINYSMEGKRRINLKTPINYRAQPAKVRQLLLDLVREQDFVLNEPDEPFCRLSEYGDNAMIFTLRVWSLAENYWALRFNLLEEIKKMLDQEGLAIPYSQLEVHLNSSD